MFIYSFRITAGAADAKSVELARKIAESVTRITGNPVRLHIRVGGPLELLFTGTYESLDALLEAQGKLAADAGYQAQLASTLTEGGYVPGSSETAIWVEA